MGNADQAPTGQTRPASAFGRSDSQPATDQRDPGIADCPRACLGVAGPACTSLGLIIYAARNQYDHRDDKEPHEVQKNVFGALSAAFYDNMLADLAVDLSNPTINVYANEVLLGALGWRSYDTYLAEMKSLLS
jgi:hypothetical protein